MLGCSMLVPQILSSSCPLSPFCPISFQSVMVCRLHLSAKCLKSAPLSHCQFQLESTSLFSIKLQMTYNDDYKIRAHYPAVVFLRPCWGPSAYDVCKIFRFSEAHPLPLSFSHNLLFLLYYTYAYVGDLVWLNCGQSR